MSPAEFEPAIPESHLPQNHALHRAATGIGKLFEIKIMKKYIYTLPR
jgi:hypothetical protein